MNLIHISDLHIHRNRADNEDVSVRLAGIKIRYPDDMLIITGDITDDGHPDQFKNAATIPGLKVPGNHDFGAAGNFYERAKADLFDDTFGTKFAGNNYPAVDVIAGVRLIGLDSNIETDNPFDFACGEIGKRQLRVLRGILNGPVLPTVVYMHHHPFIRYDPFMELRDARKFMRTIYGEVDVLLFGHRHVEQIWSDCCGIKLIHAAGRLGDMDKVLRINISDGQVSSRYV